MHLMEYCGFASGVSSHGPNSPFVQEGVIKDYSTELMESLSLTSVSPYDFISLDFSAIQQGLMNVYLSLVESTNSRSVGVGILAVTAIYGAWKAIGAWNRATHLPGSDAGYDYEDYPVKRFRRDDGNKRKDYANSTFHRPGTSRSMERCHGQNIPVVSVRVPQTKNAGGDDLAAVSENFQRQLKDAMSRMDDVKFRLKELENDKDLLTTEIDARKQMIIKLQEENSSERERRQQAELKMEMMSFENSQIRQLRKEISIKSGQVEKLEKLIKEKDDLQMKMFEDNIVLPRSVVEARAKEFSELQNRVHQLQAETDSAKRFRDFHLECQPCRLSKSVWLESDSLSIPAAHLNESQVTSKKNYPTETSIALLETSNKQIINAKLKLADRSPNVPRQLAKSTEKTSNKRGSRTSPSLILSNKVPPDVNYVFNLKDSKSVSHVGSKSKTGEVEDLTNNSGSAHRRNLSVFAQIRSLVTASKGNSSYCDPANLALLKHIGALLNSTRPNNRLVANGENPLSDEQSSVFMSASDGSDTDMNGLHDIQTRKYQNKRATPLKRLSRYRRNRRRDGAIKRRLAVKYFDGQAHLIGLGESSAPPSCPEHSDSSTVNKSHIVANADSNTHNSAHYLRDNEDSSESVLKACDKNNMHGGESWILIIPKAS